MSAQAEKTALEVMLANWLEATNQGGDAGADGYAAFVTDDAVMLPPNAERVDGRAAVREMALGFTSRDGFQISWKANRIDFSADGEHAHVIGEFELSMKNPAGSVVSDRGKFFDAFDKQADGSWLCSIGTWSSNLPAA